MHYFILANIEAFKAAARYQKRSNSIQENWLLFVVIGALAAFWTAYYFWDRYRKQQQSQSNKQKPVFFELCDAHHLSRGERGLLRKVLELKSVPHPALLFVNNDYLAEFTKGPAADAAEYSRLMAKVFGAPRSK